MKAINLLVLNYNDQPNPRICSYKTIVTRTYCLLLTFGRNNLMKNTYLCTHTRVIQQSKKQYNTKRLNVTRLAMAKMITVGMLWNINYAKIYMY